MMFFIFGNGSLGFPFLPKSNQGEKSLRVKALLQILQVTPVTVVIKYVRRLRRGIVAIKIIFILGV